jgi:hypothetical protein
LDEVCGPAFFALLVTGVAFLPILALDGQEGRLFQPLAWAKSLTILVAALILVYGYARYIKRDLARRGKVESVEVPTGLPIFKGDRS